MITLIKVNQIHKQIQKIVEENICNDNNQYTYYLYRQIYKKQVSTDLTNFSSTTKVLPKKNDIVTVIVPIDFINNQCNQYLVLLIHFIIDPNTNKPFGKMTYNGAYFYHIIKNHTKLIATVMKDEFYLNKICNDMFYFPIWERYIVLYYKNDFQLIHSANDSMTFI